MAALKEPSLKIPLQLGYILFLNVGAKIYTFVFLQCAVWIFLTLIKLNYIVLTT